MLDPPAARAFLTDLERAAGDRGVLVITHQRGGLEETFDRVLELRDGRLLSRANEPLGGVEARRGHGAPVGHDHGRHRVAVQARAGG